MSTEYFIFTKCDDICDVLLTMSSVDGVAVNGKDLQIKGLLNTAYTELDSSTHEVMRDEFGEYGLDVNWRIGGTFDKSFDIIEVMDRLFQCTASIINSRPDADLSLMRNGEDFFIFNTANQLIVSPVYVTAIPSLMSRFKKPITLRNIE